MSSTSSSVAAAKVAEAVEHLWHNPPVAASPEAFEAFAIVARVSCLHTQMAFLSHEEARKCFQLLSKVDVRGQRLPVSVLPRWDVLPDDNVRVEVINRIAYSPDRLPPEDDGDTLEKLAVTSTMTRAEILQVSASLADAALDIRMRSEANLLWQRRLLPSLWGVRNRRTHVRQLYVIWLVSNNMALLADRVQEATREFAGAPVFFIATHVEADTTQLVR